MSGQLGSNPMLLPNLNSSTASGGVLVGQSPAQILATFPRVAATCAVTLATNPTNGDVLTLTVSNNVLPGGSLAVSFTASSDTVDTSAEKLAAALNNNLVARMYNIFGTSLSGVLTVNELGPVGNSTSVVFSSTGSTTASYSNSPSDTVTVGGSVNPRSWAVNLTGSATESDVNSLQFTSTGLSGSPISVTYTTQADDTLTLVAAGLSTAIADNATLAAAGITASNTGANLTVVVPASLNATLANNSSGGNSELYTPTQAAGKTITLRFTNGSFAGGHEDVSYTMLNGDSLTTLATALNAGVNADSVLEAAGISSTRNSLVLTIAQTGPEYATLSNASSGSPSETLSFADASGNLVGGSGAVVPLAAFSSSFGSNFQNFRPGQPVDLNSVTVAILVANASPVK